MRRASGVLIFCFLLAAAWVYLPGAENLARAGTGAVMDWSLRDPQKIVVTVLPGWLGMAPADLGQIAADILARAARIDLADSRRLLASQLSPPLANPALMTMAATPVVPRLPSPSGESVQRLEHNPEKAEKVTVGIYHTHTGESYQLTDGVERVDGRPGGVVAVGQVLKRALKEKHGIGVVHSEKVHDVPYNRSYLESEQTVRHMLSEHPDLQLLLDIHRDSILDRSRTVTEIGGQQVATILLIVGSDARQPFPGWRENYRLARAVAAKAQELYPGLCVGVRVKEGRYNQFLHPGALLVEVGGVANHTEEALRTAELLADILAAVLVESTGE